MRGPSTTERGVDHAEGHVAAFEWFGGVFDIVRYDNLKAAVARVIKGRRRVESDRFVALRSHYRFESSFCLVRFGTNPDPTGRAASTRREAQLLREVAARSPLPTPVPELVMPDEAASSTASCPACRCWDFALAGGRTSTPP